MSTTGPSNSSDIDELVCEIEQAFSGVRLDGGISMAQAIVAEQSISPPHAQIEPPKSSTTSWNKIDPKLIDEFNFILTWIDAKGFKFYIPAFMIWTLRNPGSASLVEENTVSALAPVKRILNGHKVNPNKASMHTFLSSEQRKVIRRFLEHEATHEEHATVAQLALDHYW